MTAQTKNNTGTEHVLPTRDSEQKRSDANDGNNKPASEASNAEKSSMNDDDVLKELRYLFHLDSDACSNGSESTADETESKSTSNDDGSDPSSRLEGTPKDLDGDNEAMKSRLSDEELIDMEKVMGHDDFADPSLRNFIGETLQSIHEDKRADAMTDKTAGADSGDRNDVTTLTDKTTVIMRSGGTDIDLTPIEVHEETTFSSEASAQMPTPKKVCNQSEQKPDPFDFDSLLKDSVESMKRTMLDDVADDMEQSAQDKKDEAHDMIVEAQVLLDEAQTDARAAADIQQAALDRTYHGDDMVAAEEEDDDAHPLGPEKKEQAQELVTGAKELLHDAAEDAVGAVRIRIESLDANQTPLADEQSFQS